MTDYYFDTQLVKLYHDELNTSGCRRDFLNEENQIVISEIAFALNYTRLYIDGEE